MNKRILGKSNMNISEIALGTWQVGGKWGSNFDYVNADRIINGALDKGVNFIDTADVYSDGESEKAVGKAARGRSEKIYVATKCGRQINPHVSAGYTPKVLRKYVEDSLKRTGLERLDLVQLHCPPTEVYYRPEIFSLFDDLKKEGKIANLGVSVEKIEEAIKAIEFDNVTSVQIIFNIFRQRPAELFFNMAKKKNVGVIVRVPLASGLLTGKFGKSTRFEAGDHRNFNRDGKAFDKGETFAGVPYELGLEAVEEIKSIFPPDASLAQLALRWVLMFDAVSTVIPGASSPEQAEANCAAAALPPLTETQMKALKTLYDGKIKPLVHHLW